MITKGTPILGNPDIGGSTSGPGIKPTDTQQ